MLVNLVCVLDCTIVLLTSINKVKLDELLLIKYTELLACVDLLHMRLPSVLMLTFINKNCKIFHLIRHLICFIEISSLY